MVPNQDIINLLDPADHWHDAEIDLFISERVGREPSRERDQGLPRGLPIDHDDLVRGIGGGARVPRSRLTRSRRGGTGSTGRQGGELEGGDVALRPAAPALLGDGEGEEGIVGGGGGGARVLRGRGIGRRRRRERGGAGVREGLEGVELERREFGERVGRVAWRLHFRRLCPRPAISERENCGVLEEEEMREGVRSGD